MEPTSRDRAPDAPRTLSGLVAERARREPDALAVASARGSLTLGELDRRARRVSGGIAGSLTRRARGPERGANAPLAEARIGIFLSRSPDLVAALLGVLRAGAAYVPLDPAHPVERLELIARDAGLRAVITERSLAGRLPAGGSGLRTLLIDELLAEGEPAGAPAVALPGPTPDRLAYVIYTSGSTGAPKGVAIEHRSAVAMLDWARRTITPAERRGLLAATSICFDLSVFELFLPLAWGGTVVLVDDALALAGATGAAGAAGPVDPRVTLVNTVPSVMTQLLRQGSPPPLPPSVRTVALAGEPLPRSLADALYALPGVERVLNLYGPSEDTTYSTWQEVAAGEDGPPPIGVPLPGTTARVLAPEGWGPADQGERTPAEPAVGELFLGGAGLARGYLGKPALTAGRFVPDPFGESAGGRLYRTGDRVRRRPDGGLDFLGRLDHQVKLRGFRIELGEIEAVLDRHPAVTGVAAVVRGEGAERRIVAYLACTAGRRPAVRELREHLARSLPAYMVPGRFVLLDALPLTATGKIDRRALPDPDAPSDSADPAGSIDSGDSADSKGTRPLAGPLEERLADVWQEVLGVRPAGGDASFLELGGHSLSALQVVARVRRAFGVELPRAALFERPELASLARLVEELGTETADRADPPVRPWSEDPEGDAPPASSSQRGIWLSERRHPGTARFNVPLAIDLEGPVDGVPLVASLAASLVEIERRHEPLRTVLREVDGGPVQQVLPPSASGGAGRLPVVDLTGLTGGPRSSRALEAATRRASRRRLDLEGETPPWRALLLRTGERRHRLLLVIHHAACDDRAIVVLLEELATLVRAHRAGEDLATVLPELPVRYTDYARWQHRETRDGRLDGPLRDWLERLEGFRAGVEPPADRRPPKVPDHRGDRCTIRIPGDRAEELRRFARDERASVFTVLLAAFGALIARSTGSDDVVVTSPATGRERLELEGLIGVFVNSVPLRLELGGDPGFREVVARARETVLGALAHQEVPFDRLIEELRRSRPGRGDDADSLRGVVLAYRGRDRLLEELAPGLRLRVEELGNGTAKNGLTLFAVDGEDAGGGLELTAELATALYDVSTVRRLLSHLRVLLEGVLADPDRRLAELPLLTAAERHQVLVEANDTVVPGRVRAPEWRVPTTLQGLFAAQAARTPDRVAVSDGARQVTFAALARAAASVSARLRARGVGAEDRVGFCIERSPEMVVAALGILGAGAAFVPLDPSDPAERLAFMLRTAGTGALITVPRLAGAFAPFVRGLTMTVGREIWRERERVAGPEPGPPPEGGDPEHLAYVIFTSGSTGGPKGVMIQQRAIWHRLAWEQRVFPLGEADRVLQKTPVTFDPSLWELFLPLAVGARMELAAPGEHRDTASLAATVAARRITALQLVPSQLALLVELVESDGAGRTGGAGPALFAGFPRLFCGGEALPAELARRWAGLVPEVPLYNFYGPAEAAIDVTFGPASGPAAPAASTVSIGRSLDDVAVYLVDRHLEPVPLGQPGELVVAGDHVGRGYVDRPGMTAERFVPDPFPSPDLSSRRGALLYRTGDLARRLPDGRIEFLGRLDHQVKIRGRRIELGEVEAALAALPGVARAAAAVAGTGGERRLVGYLVPAAPDRAPAPSPGSPERYREILARSLPEVMIPSVFVLLDALPRTPSGKVDRRALPAPDASALGAATAFRPPETSLERRIAALWGELLGVERVGRDDDFFALGGHSLLATRMLFRLRREPGGGPELPLAAVFERRTVAGLAAEIESLGGAPAPGTPAISASPGPVSAGIPGAIPRRRRAPNVRLTDDGEVLAVDEPPRGD